MGLLYHYTVLPHLHIHVPRKANGFTYGVGRGGTTGSHDTRVVLPLHIPTAEVKSSICLSTVKAIV